MSAATPQNEQARQDAAREIAEIALKTAAEVRWHLSFEQVETSARAWLERMADDAKGDGQ